MKEDKLVFEVTRRNGKITINLDKDGFSHEETIGHLLAMADALREENKNRIIPSLKKRKGYI
jgi:hypothetical protein